MTARRLRPAVGLALTAAGAVSWALALAFLDHAARAGEKASSAVDDEGIPGDRWLSLWVHDLRWAAIIVVVCGLALTVRGSGWRKHAALVAGGLVLLVADGVFTSMRATGWSAAAGALGVASAVAAAVATRRPDAKAEDPQRHLVGYGIVAACCAPLLLTNAQSEAGRFIPAGMTAGLGIVQVLLVLAAISCAVSAMPHVPRAAVPLAAGFAAVLGTAGALAAGNTDVVFAILLGGPLVVAVLALTARPRSARSYLALAAIVAGYPFVLLVVSFTTVEPMAGALALSGDSYSADGIAAVPAGLLAGAVAGLLTVWTRSSRRPAAPVQTNRA
ncbi:hypothetical protein GCM10010191_39910 [Actinomadura vinacea]|uniref:Integral membrane protein n=1 Tax=Actinomadura vinacea TaxID=115336 RepID=A0ABN3J970_9ACTN